MPEGDTVFLSATRLQRALAGETLRHTEFRIPSLATADLSGRSVEEVTSVGKHLLFRISGGVTLHTHFEMEGSWHLYRPGERWKGPTFQVRALLKTDPWTAVGFRLPVIELLETAREDDALGHLGPDPLRAWDPEEATRRVEQEAERPIGDVLIDQRAIAGLGNVYRSETCFLAGLDPRTRVGEVADVRKIVDLAARLIRANKTTGTQVTTGDPRPRRRQWVYGRAGEPCRRCGTPIERAGGGPGLDDRVVFWCPRCQPPPATGCRVD